MIIPSVVRSRDDHPFKPTGEDRLTHSAIIDDFCIACGADLRVRRRLVTEVNAGDAHRLSLCESAELLLMGGPVDERLEKELVDLGFTPSDFENMAGVLCEGLEPVTTYCFCGLEGVDLVGVTDDGEFLYAKDGRFARPNVNTQS